MVWYHLSMIKEPKILRQFLSSKEIADFRHIIGIVKESKDFKVDNDYFYRNYSYDPVSLLPYHKFVSKFFSKLIKQDLEPTYSFISMYERGLGICPLHIDRLDCLLTVNVCIDQAGPWPIYVNHTTPYLADHELIEHQETIKNESVEYILNPGDALVYSGPFQPHWRNKIQQDNFCDLIFFHFKKKDS
jgi:hypothetical protein